MRWQIEWLFWRINGKEKRYWERADGAIKELRIERKILENATPENQQK